MEFSVRYLKEEDYNMLCEWWKDWKWTPPPRDFLPQNGSGGLILEKEGVPIVAGFVYFTNSKVAWNEFVVSNFQYKDKDRKEAIKILICELVELAKSKGSKYIYTVVKNQNLKKTYQEIGFSNGSVKVDEMVLIL